MKKILAVSGGVDSMVMMDIMRKVERIAVVEQWRELERWGCARPRVVVMSFDHRTRESSAADVDFVERKACGKRLMYRTSQMEEDGEKSEEAARKARYDFLRKEAKRLTGPNLYILREDYDEDGIAPPTNDGAEIYTAHHLDDLVETVAINLLRGTGWRGLAPLDSPGIRRPFLEPELLNHVEIDGTASFFTGPLDKRQILIYAAKHKIVFRHDPTNTSDQYLRNRVREKMRNFGFESKMAIYRLWQRQKELKKEIEAAIAELLPAEGMPWERSWFRDLTKTEDGEKIACELLRAGLQRAEISATRPQIQQFFQAILDYQPGKYFNLPGDKLAKITKKQVFLP